MIRLLLVALSTATYAASFGQDLPSKPSLTLDEQSAWIVTTTRVSRQLKLDSTQKQKVDGAFAAYGQSEKAIFAHGAATEQQLDGIDHALASKVLSDLNEKQRSRLHQISLQLKGPFILDEPQIGREVNLAAAQASAIHKIVEKSALRDQDLDNRQAEIFLSKPHATQPQRDKLIASMAPMRLAVDRKRRADEQAVLNLLKPDQKKKWSDMLGEKLP